MCIRNISKWSYFWKCFNALYSALLQIYLLKIYICTSNLGPVIINMHANKNLQSGNVFLITFNKHASSDSLNTRGWQRGCCFLSNFKFRSSNFFLPLPSFFFLSLFTGTNHYEPLRYQPGAQRRGNCEILKKNWIISRTKAIFCFSKF